MGIQAPQAVQTGAHAIARFPCGRAMAGTNLGPKLPPGAVSARLIVISSYTDSRITQRAKCILVKRRLRIETGDSRGFAHRCRPATNRSRAKPTNHSLLCRCDGNFGPRLG